MRMHRQVRIVWCLFSTALAEMDIYFVTHKQNRQIKPVVLVCVTTANHMLSKHEQNFT